MKLSYAGYPVSRAPSSTSTSMGFGLLGSVEKEEQEKMKCAGACGLVAQCDEYHLGGNEEVVLTCVLSICIVCGSPLLVQLFSSVGVWACKMLFWGCTLSCPIMLFM